jgi:hypothetical protein
VRAKTTEINGNLRSGKSCRRVPHAVNGAFYFTESSTALAVAFTSRPTPRTVLAHEARKIAQTRMLAVKTRVMVMN